ncbi:MAG: response regulator [Clostridia bacterium]|nr:response regulator [Clostridia bacterium]
MYRVLIVDDELPAQRFVRSIIEQFASRFQVTGTAASGEQGLQFLQQNTVDLLITDISMHGMNGIELAKMARAIQPNIHIVIISGFGEFEYAQGAIQAGVDEYLLKPVSISKMTAILQSLEKKMKSDTTDLTAVLLPAIACRHPYSKDDAAQLYHRKSFRFVLVRWGNLDMALPHTLGATTLAPQGEEPFRILRGRDAEEQILIAPEGPMEEFLSSLSVYMTCRGNLSTWTAVYTPSVREIEFLPDFIGWALNMLYYRTVIGRHKILQFTGGTSAENRIFLPAADLKQFSYFITAGKFRMIRDYFLSQAVSWEKEQTPQRQVWHMARQIIREAASASQVIGARFEEILADFNNVIRTAPSYSAMMTGLYSLLFDQDSIRNRKLSAQELYDYAVQYIRENYAQPLSMQSVCDEIGISQTYLSRLFRKYSDTTFNTLLTKCRMEAAMKLLQEKPDLLLRDVAACVGYDDSSYFTKVFHQYTGKTPSQFVSADS